MDQSTSGTSQRHAVQPSDRPISVDALRGFDRFWIAGGGPFVMAFFKLFANPLPAWLERQLALLHVPQEDVRAHLSCLTCGPY
jgi:hypothetical protein